MNETQPSDLLENILSRNSQILGKQDTAAALLDENTIISRLEESCISVLSKMCQVDVASSGKSEGRALRRFEFSGVIGISGAARITVAVNLSEEFVLHVAESMMGGKPAEIDSDVIDLVGELANMIVGNAKERLRNADLTLGLPTVVSGVGHQVEFSTDMSVTVIHFASEVGEILIEVGVSHIVC